MILFYMAVGLFLIYLTLPVLLASLKWSRFIDNLEERGFDAKQLPPTIWVERWFYFMGGEVGIICLRRYHRLQAMQAQKEFSRRFES